MILGMSIVALLLAALPALVYFGNLSAFSRVTADLEPDGTEPSVSVLIPARNEQHGIAACVGSILASERATVEVVVLDDQSEDETATIVRDMSAADERVRLIDGQPLPAGWCGKQHACGQLADNARYDVLMFLDADVRLAPAAVARSVAMLRAERVDLLSGFPRQETGTLLEQLLIPLIHFVLLGFLSLRRMRATTHPAFGAGCGQWFITTIAAYRQAGGHAAIRSSLHDGLKLPRAYREAGLRTDVFDGTDLASCRMYRSATEVWSGLAKNATEGMANARLIVPATLLLGLGQVAPLVLLVVAISTRASLAAVLVAAAATALAHAPRLSATVRFRQPLLGAVLHPLSVTLLLLIQWIALLRSFGSANVTWKGRPYTAT